MRGTSLALLATAAAAAVPVLSGRFGNHIGINLGVNYPYDYHEAEAVAALGGTLARWQADWAAIEAPPGAAYNWSATDALVSQLAAFRITPYVIIQPTHPGYDAGAWQTPALSGWPAFTKYAAAFAARYPLAAFELGNEANMEGKATPAAYASFAVPAAAVISTAAPSALVFAPAAASYLCSDNVWLVQFLRNLTSAGTATAFFTGISGWTQHPYVGETKAVSPEHDVRCNYTNGTSGGEIYDVERETLDFYGGQSVTFNVGERGFSSLCTAAEAYSHFGGCDDEFTKAAMYVRQTLWGHYKGGPSAGRDVDLPALWRAHSSSALVTTPAAVSGRSIHADPLASALPPRGFTMNYVLTDAYKSGKDILGKESYSALSVMATQLAGLFLIGRADTGSDDDTVALAFVSNVTLAAATAAGVAGGGSLIRSWAIWNKVNAASNATVNVAAGCSNAGAPAVLFNMTGGNTTLLLTSGSVTVPATVAPVYVVFTCVQ